MSDKTKIKARTLQVETGWSYQACLNLLRKYRGDYEQALADVKAALSRGRHDAQR